ncbi:mitochondrial branched-chain alpha-ketoacid dehydrogenase kinase-domain-containing protein [Pisolithus thermaeus]|nr:mitochondrial branched-chain alpha-ketoacid dehydrogenase kinase-domain-containing protein [Pisolithus croceorrhizus]KAI6168590.1 mitochondrial branched-chain alpha-ketoacid dehydrogenase kinase-domain-containing protein [Pisolithus thermaeus]
MSAGFRISPALWERIHYFASFPQTGVSLQQMVLFGQHPSQGTLLKASQFLSEELPVRLAHRVKELDALPCNLSDMPSIRKVKDWYAHSFEELINFPPLALSPSARQSLNALLSSSPSTSEAAAIGRPCDPFLPPSIPNPALSHDQMDADDMGAWAFGGGGANGPYGEGVPYRAADREDGSGKDKGTAGSWKNGGSFTSVRNGGIRLRAPIEKRYYAHAPSHLYPPEVHDYNARFTRVLEAIKRRHDPTVATIAQGVLEWQRTRDIKPGSGVGVAGSGATNGGGEVQAWLDRFYMSRIGIRFLIGQHVALNSQQPHKDYVGIICTQANVHDIVQEAIENARFVCEEHYALLRGPPVQLICPRNLTFAYIPGHLSHIVFELLKNSLRAVVERFGADAEDKGVGYPPIKVIVVEGSEDITIKISDEGGGIPRRAVPLVWTYMYTTMGGQSIDQDYHAGDFQAPMAGFGYGLPLSRLYARYFGGDLRLISMDGFGTDVYIHLNKLSSSCEPLP